MAIGNRFEVIDDQLLRSQACLNVYFYRQIAGVGVGDATDLLSAFDPNVFAFILPCQAPDLTHIDLRCRNLDVPSDFVILPRIPPIAGTSVGLSEPVFVAAAFQMNSQEQGVHHGMKRYAGVPDGSVTDGVPDAPFLASLNNLATHLDDNLTGVSGAIYEPRIMRRLLDATGHLIGYEDHPMGLASFRRISTQNTRKR